MRVRKSWFEGGEVSSLGRRVLTMGALAMGGREVNWGTGAAVSIIAGEEGTKVDEIVVFFGSFGVSL